MIEASCHCGAVRIGIDALPDTLTRCTCSICHRYGALWAYCTRETARLVTGQEAERVYRWGEGRIEFYHCATCGCMTRYEATAKHARSRFALNARMCDPGALTALTIRTFDGAETWKYID